MVVYGEILKLSPQYTDFTSCCRTWSWPPCSFNRFQKCSSAKNSIQPRRKLSIFSRSTMKILSRLEKLLTTIADRRWIVLTLRSSPVKLISIVDSGARFAADQNCSHLCCRAWLAERMLLKHKVALVDFCCFSVSESRACFLIYQPRAHVREQIFTRVIVRRPCDRVRSRTFSGDLTCSSKPSNSLNVLCSAGLPVLLSRAARPNGTAKLLEQKELFVRK